MTEDQQRNRVYDANVIVREKGRRGVGRCWRNQSRLFTLGIRSMTWHFGHISSFFCCEFEHPTKSIPSCTMHQRGQYPWLSPCKLLHASALLTYEVKWYQMRGSESPRQTAVPTRYASLSALAIASHLLTFGSLPLSCQNSCIDSRHDTRLPLQGSQRYGLHDSTSAHICPGPSHTRHPSTPLDSL